MITLTKHILIVLASIPLIIAMLIYIAFRFIFAVGVCISNIGKHAAERVDQYAAAYARRVDIKIDEIIAEIELQQNRK